ncbi:MAG: hypothetical protein U1F20_02420 [Lysobacterales bacterium]
MRPKISASLRGMVHVSTRNRRIESCQSRLDGGGIPACRLRSPAGARTSFGDLNGGANDAVLQPDGKIVAVGFQAYYPTPKGVQACAGALPRALSNLLR